MRSVRLLECDVHQYHAYTHGHRQLICVSKMPCYCGTPQSQCIAVQFEGLLPVPGLKVEDSSCKLA